VDSDTNSVEQDFGRPREYLEKDGSDSRGERSAEGTKKRKIANDDDGKEEDEDDIMDEDDDVMDNEDIDIGLTDGDDTMVDSLLDEDSPKTASLLEFGVKDEKKKAVPRTTGQIRTTGASAATTRGRGRGRGASTIGVRISRGASQSSLASRNGRTMSQSSVYSSISAANSLYTPVSREPSTNSVGAASSSSSSNGLSDFTEAPGMGSFIGSGVFTGSKRPRSQMILENRNRLKSKVSSDGRGASGSANVETLHDEEVEEVELVEEAAKSIAPQMKKRKVGASAGTGVNKGKGEMLPPALVPEGRGKKPF
jgi:hypothetical protein